MAKQRQRGAMTWVEIGVREGISAQAAQQCFKRGMKKLRGFKRREIVLLLKFYGDALEQARDGVDRYDAAVSHKVRAA